MLPKIFEQEPREVRGAVIVQDPHFDPQKTMHDIERAYGRYRGFEFNHEAGFSVFGKMRKTMSNWLFPISAGCFEATQLLIWDKGMRDHPEWSNLMQSEEWFVYWAFGNVFHILAASVIAMYSITKVPLVIQKQIIRRRMEYFQEQLGIRNAENINPSNPQNPNQGSLRIEYNRDDQLHI